MHSSLTWRFHQLRYEAWLASFSLSAEDHKLDFGLGLRQNKMEKGPYDWENKPFMLQTCLYSASEESTLGLFWFCWFCIWCRSGEANGAGREAFLIVETFPFDTTYTVQKSGAPLDTVLGTSALNFLYNKTTGVKWVWSLNAQIHQQKMELNSQFSSLVIVIVDYLSICLWFILTVQWFAYQILPIKVQSWGEYIKFC
jgi:hypothetical protein